MKSPMKFGRMAGHGLGHPFLTADIRQKNCGHFAIMASGFMRSKKPDRKKKFERNTVSW